MKTLLSAVAAATLALAAVEAGADGMLGEQQVALMIESTSLADALDQWAQQSGFQIFVQSEATKNLTTQPLKGTFTARAALEHLLAGTPLTYVWISEKAVSIRKKPQTVPAALQRTDIEAHQSNPPLARFSGRDVGSASASNSASESGDAALSVREIGANIDDVEELIVTGTHIRGAAPVGSQLIVVDREQLKTSGYGRAQDFLDTLPQNFSGNAGEDWSNDFGAGNLTRGQAVDLRGLGASSTLVLIDGRRQPAGGTQGSFVDISSIPTAAIERIEVLPDGASAIYGSDAIGGVVNFVLRKDYQGIEWSQASRFRAFDGPRISNAGR